MGNSMSSGFNIYALFYIVESAAQLARRPLPPMTINLVGFNGILKILEYLFSKKLLSIYEYSVLPAYALDHYFLTSSLFLSNLIHADLIHNMN